MVILIEDNPANDNNPNNGQQIYTLRFHGEAINVIVTSSPLVAENWARTILNQNSELLEEGRLVAGFAVEWAVGNDNTPASTLQICVDDRCLVFQLERANSVPPALREFLNTVKLVGIRNENDKAKLRASRHEINLGEGQLLDLRHFASRPDGTTMATASFSDMVNLILGRHMTLSDVITTSDWSVENLNEFQVMQASSKAYASYAIGILLRAHHYFTH